MHEIEQINLIEAAAAGDIESFGELCRRHYSAMVAVAYSVLCDHQLAEDAAQEAFARALVNLRNLKKKERFAPWLASICKNVAKDMLTLKTREAQDDSLNRQSEIDSLDENNEFIRRAIENLPVTMKELVVLKYYDGLSYEQISSVMGMSKASINGRLTRAKRKMASYLKSSGFPENKL